MLRGRHWNVSTKMNKHQIIYYPSKILMGKASPVEIIDEGVRKLAKRMTSIMVKHGGVGLAAPQVGVPLRLFIVSLDGTMQNVKTYINPIIATSGMMVSDKEGCLSVPDIFIEVQRYNKCKITAADLNGNKFSYKTKGFHARILQHEYDHLNGIVLANKLNTKGK